MSQQVTLEDVAKVAGVHKTTVSRALNSSTRSIVNSQTARRIIEAAETLGYVPNLTARSLRVQTTMTVGVVIPDLTNAIFPPMVRGIESYLSKHGYTVLLADTDESPDAEGLAITSLLERRVDGFIVATGTEEDLAIAKLFDLGTPVVLVNRGAGNVPCPLVTGDNVAGIYAVVAHLKDLGHRDIVHLAGPTNVSTIRTRTEAFRRACQDAGLNGRVVGTAVLRADAGEEAMDSLLTEGLNFTAVVAATDLLALGVLRSLRRHGLVCPDEVSVVGFNDMPFSEEFGPGLTTVRVPLAEMGEEAARLLVRTLGGEVLAPRVLTMPVALVKRNSTARGPHYGEER